MAFCFRALWVTGSVLVASACVSDPKIEDEIPPTVGAHQSKTNGTEITAEEACTKLLDAEKGARDDLGCDVPDDLACPGHLKLAGAKPCDKYDEGSVDACIAEIGKYRSCGDFDRVPCVATLVLESCTPPALPEAGTPDAEAGSDAGDGGDSGDGGGATDASDGGGAEGGPDAARDGSVAPDGSTSEAGADASDAAQSD